MSEERSFQERDNELRKQHAIMQAQRRQLQAANIERFNKDLSLQHRVTAENERKKVIEGEQKRIGELGDLRDMPVYKA